MIEAALMDITIVLFRTFMLSIYVIYRRSFRLNVIRGRDNILSRTESTAMK